MLKWLNIIRTYYLGTVTIAFASLLVPLPSLVVRLCDKDCGTFIMGCPVPVLCNVLRYSFQPPLLP